jgi:hypothetical protein
MQIFIGHLQVVKWNEMQRWVIITLKYQIHLSNQCHTLINLINPKYALASDIPLHSNHPLTSQAP